MNELKIAGIDTIVNDIVSDIVKRGEELVANADVLATVVTTPANVGERKKDRALINKAKTDLDNERKAFEKKWKSVVSPVLEMYKRFDISLKSAIDEIDSALSEIERSRIDEKIKACEEIFNRTIVPEEINGWFSFVDVFNEKWRNSTYTLKQVEDDITDFIAKLQISYSNVKALNHKYESEGLQVLRETLDFQAAIARMSELTKAESVIESKKSEVKKENDYLPFGNPDAKKRIVIVAKSERSLEIANLLIENNIEFTMEDV